jgi:uncharacterized protein (TIGR04255 family)
MPTATPLRSGFRFGSVDLPNEFAHPPLTEAWLGVEFAPPTDFSKIEAQEWRQRLGPEWPAVWQLIGAAERHSLGMSPVEKQLRNVMNDRAIRFTPCGFSFGWLGHDGSRYPRYEAIRDGFVATLDAVRDVVPQIGQHVRTSVSYLNRIPVGTVWSSARDLSFFRLWQPNPLKKLKIDAEGFAGCWQFPLEAERGTLTIELTHESEPTSPQDVESLWLRITSNGPTDAEESSLFDGLDYGREMVVRSFNELVTADAKMYWGVAPRKKSSATF